MAGSPRSGRHRILVARGNLITGENLKFGVLTKGLKILLYRKERPPFSITQGQLPNPRRHALKPGNHQSNQTSLGLIPKGEIESLFGFGDFRRLGN